MQTDLGYEEMRNLAHQAGRDMREGAAVSDADILRLWNEKYPLEAGSLREGLVEPLVAFRHICDFVGGELMMETSKLAHATVGDRSSDYGLKHSVLAPKLELRTVLENAFTTFSNTMQGMFLFGFSKGMSWSDAIELLGGPATGETIGRLMSVNLIASPDISNYLRVGDLTLAADIEMLPAGFRIISGGSLDNMVAQYSSQERVANELAVRRQRLHDVGANSLHLYERAFAQLSEAERAAVLEVHRYISDTLPTISSGEYLRLLGSPLRYWTAYRFTSAMLGTDLVADEEHSVELSEEVDIAQKARACLRPKSALAAAYERVGYLSPDELMFIEQSFGCVADKSIRRYVKTYQTLLQRAIELIILDDKLQI